MPTPYAHGYTVLGKPGFDITHISPSLFPASGAIISSVGDIADFYRAVLSDRLLPPKLLKAMKTMVPIGSLDSGTGATGANGYGLGLMRWPTACGAAWGHDGGVPGYWTRSYSSDNGRRQAVLMINHDPETLAIPRTRALPAPDRARVLQRRVEPDVHELQDPAPPTADEWAALPSPKQGDA